MRELICRHTHDHVIYASISDTLAEAQLQLCLSIKNPKVLAIVVCFSNIKILRHSKIGEHFINLTSMNEIVIYVGIYQIWRPAVLYSKS